MTRERNAVYSKQVPIRFSHCDPAGIVYFPQYLVLTNWLVEDWFTDDLGVDFAEFIGARRFGLPIVKLQCEFLKPSRHGDSLRLSLAIARLGRRSLTVDIVGSTGGEMRLRTEQVMVMMSLDTKAAIEFPHDVRLALERAAAIGAPQAAAAPRIR